jgi:anti-sigma-K factor RskA
MIDEPKQDLLVQYLLNEVDSSTAEKIRAELETDAELREFVRETEHAFASMAYAVSPMEPPVGLTQRILRSERNISRVSSPAPRSNIVWLVVPWALAACLAIACVLLGLERTRLQKKSEQLGQELLALRQKNAQVEGELATLQKKSEQLGQELLALQQKNAQVEGELATLQKKNVFAELKIATLKAQVAAYQTATAVVVWDKIQKNGLLQLDKLPPPAPGKDYQLWVIDPKIPQPVSAGVLKVPNNGLIRASFHPATPIDSAGAFAISVEKAGGASKPEGQIILVGK